LRKRNGGKWDNIKVKEHRRKKLGKGQPGPLGVRDLISKICMVLAGRGKKGIRKNGNCGKGKR